MKESEQNRFENMRSLLDDKARELITFQKQLRQQITRLVSHFYDSSLRSYCLFTHSSEERHTLKCFEYDFERIDMY